nr:hypothetical protein [uncultured Celeribacter sp.]
MGRAVPGASAPVSTSVSILIADHDIWTRDALCEYLEPEGIRVALCDAPEEAPPLCLGADPPYQVVFLGVQFSRDDPAYGVAKALHVAMGDTVPAIIGITPFFEHVEAVDWGAFGMDDLLLRPVQKWLVINLVRRFCA